MAWSTRVVLLFSFSLGAVLYSSFGLLIETMGCLRAGHIPPVLYLPVAVIYLTLFLCHRMAARHEEPFQVTLSQLGGSLLAASLGFIFANLAWGAAGSCALDRAWNRAKAEGWAVEAPAHLPFDPSEDNGVTWLRRVHAGLKDRYDQKEQDLLHHFIHVAQLGRVDPGELSQVKKILGKNRDILGLLSRAAQCPKLSWEPIGYDMNKGPIPHYGNLLMAARLAACQSIVSAKEGRYEEATRWIGVGLWIGNAAYQPKILIGDMIGVAVDSLTLDAVQYRFSRLPEKSLEAAWNQDVDPDGLMQTLHYSLSMEYLLSGKMMAEEGLSLWGQHEKLITKWCYFMLGPFEYFDGITRIQQGEKLLAAFRLPFAQMEPAYQKGNEDLKKNGWLFAQIATPKFDQIYAKALSAATYLRLSRLGLAARRYFEKHHRWPSTLEDLLEADALQEDFTDPFSGGKMHLKISGKDLLIYSVGWDMKDDGGEKIYDQKSTEGDIVFRLALPLPGKD